jgi:hypothetical protein
MTISALSLTTQTSGGGTVKDPGALIQQAASYGSGVLPSANWTVSYSATVPQSASAGAITVGSTGAVTTADCWYLAQRALAATTYDSLCLTATLLDAEGNAISFKTIQSVELFIINPTLSPLTWLKLGPQNQTAAWSGTGSLYPAANAAGTYETVWWHYLAQNPWGWTVDHTTPLNCVIVDNPQAASVTYAIWLLGTQ